MFLNNLEAVSLEYPDRAVPLESPFYVDRTPSEQLSCDEILKPGSVTRIQAPQKMGKSSLLLRIINFARKQSYKVVKIDFQEADKAVYANLNKFLRWFCANIARQLKLKPLLDEYWDEEMGSKVSCGIYLEGYLLEEIDTPIVLALNEVNLVFEHQHIAEEFLPMLRFWHEQARQSIQFQKLRFVVVHSTEVYLSLDINQSPFNIGLPIKLSEFNLEQVRDLAGRHGLNWTGANEAQQLMAMVGGHPYLVRVALYHLALEQITLEELLKVAPTQGGIYGSILRDRWEIIQKQPKLSAALKQIVMDSESESVNLEPIVSYKLESLGLVKLDGDLVYPSCQMYRLYFAGQYQQEIEQISLENLKKENQELRNLVYIDALTKISNRRLFDEHLEREWRRMARERKSISLILLDIDCFKLYNDTYGHQAGDKCLQQVASAIHSCLKRGGDLAARYGGEEFAVILPQTNLQGAVCIAGEIQNSIKAKAIEHIKSKVELKIVTASIGLTSIIPHPETDPTILLRATDEALYRSKKLGRDRINIGKIGNIH